VAGSHFRSWEYAENEAGEVARLLRKRKPMRADGEGRRVLLLMGEARGGIREHALCLARLADRRRFAITVCGPADSRLVSALAQVGVEFIPLRSRLLAGRVVAVRRALGAGFKLVHSHGYRASFLAALALWPSRRAAHVCTIHTLLPRDAFGGIGGWLKRRAAAWTLGRCEAVVAVSNATEANLRQNFPSLGTRVRTIYNGVDVSQIRPARVRGLLASSLGLEPNLPLVGTVARLSPEKGVQVLLEAARLLTDEGVAAEYVIVGDGRERAALEKMVHGLGLTAHVRFLGERRDIPQLISIFDILVVPSLSEAFSLVALMGGILGVPVVATRSGGIEEILGSELCTYVPPGDARTLANGLLAVLRRGWVPTGFLDEAVEDVAGTAEATFFDEVAEHRWAFSAYELSEEASPIMGLDESPQGPARRALLKRFDARRMVEETTSLYESTLDETNS